MNGDSAGTSDTNGHVAATLPDADLTVTSLGLDRIELVRIIAQAIDALGYPNSARSLEHEAGVEAMSPEMRTLRHCVLNGRWDHLETVLESLTVFKSNDDARAARFVLYEQKFLELLEARRTADALDCLRNHLTHLSPDQKQLNKLPLLCLCATPEEVRQQAQWPGAGPASRTAVLEKLHRFIPPTHLLQENRLENLLCQTIEQQKRITMFPYTRKNTVSLLEDMEHCQESVPRNMLHRLEGHSDEVWFVRFSHRGEYLASASRDKFIVIWKMAAVLAGDTSPEAAIHQKLQAPAEMVSSLSWSPDDTKLLSGSHDNTLRLWSIENGQCLREFRRHSDEITSVLWMPNGINFVSGSTDGTILEWDATTGQTTGSYTARGKVFDVVLSPDGSLLYTTCSDKSIQVFDTATKTQKSYWEESVSVTSLHMSFNGESLLAFTNSNENPEMEDAEIHVWDTKAVKMTHSFKGYKQSKFVIRGCLGGHNQMLVLCGSEDQRLYIWERGSGDLIAKLSGHEGTVNTVTCCESDENLFASASDDNTVIVWGALNRTT